MPPPEQQQQQESKLDSPLGPIDPQWPIQHAAKADVELEVGRLLREADDEGEAPQRLPLRAGDHPDVFAYEGRLGGFDYIEAILGPMQHPDEAMPLIVLLHGRGGRPTIPAGPYHPTRPLRLFIPRAPEPLNDGYTWLATWTNSGEIELLTSSLSERVEELMPVIDEFSALRPTQGKPIVGGFSQGGIMTFGLVTRFPERFSAAFSIAGWLPPALRPTEPDVSIFPPILAVHGGNDVVVPTRLGRETVDHLRSTGLSVESSEFEGVGHVVSADMNRIVRSWIVERLSSPSQP